MFLVGVTLFSIASLVCGLAGSTGVLVAARTVQGLGAAIVSPATLSIITTTFEEGAERNKALGIWGAMGGSGAAAGVLFGGILTKYLGWEWIFFVNVPVGALVLALAPGIVRESRAPGERQGFDVAGASIVGVLLGASIFADFFLLTLYVQNVLHFSALKTGITFLATAGTTVVVAALSQWLTTQIGPRPVMAAGLALNTGGLIWYAQIPVLGSYTRDLLGGYLMFGFGLALAFIPVSIAALAGVGPRDAGLASGLL